MGEESDESDAEQRRLDQQPMIEQGAIYSRPLANENDRAYMKQVRTPQGKLNTFDLVQIYECFQDLISSVDGDVCHHSDTEPRYKGASIPSKSFKVLQAMTSRSSNNSNASSQVNSGRKNRCFSAP